MNVIAESTRTAIDYGRTSSEDECAYRPPAEVASHDVEVLRAALLRESWERSRAECNANMQTEVARLAMDLLVREPDIEGFFGALSKTMVEQSESHTCAVWLIDEDRQRCDLWMAYVKDRLFTPPKGLEQPCRGDDSKEGFPCEALATHLYTHTPGWVGTMEYEANDPRLPGAIVEFSCRMQWGGMVATPLLLSGRTLGWMTVCSRHPSRPEDQWWRVALIEAIARQAALALHHSRLVDLNRLEARRKGILEERNRLARDIHDNLAQGFAAILMQLQGAQRNGGSTRPDVAANIETAIELARTHLIEARRSVGALRPNVGNGGEDIATALKRLADLGQRTSRVPIDLVVEELPRFGDGVEREIVAIAQEALTNAVRHSRAQRITIRAATVQAVGLRLSVADDGRGITRDLPAGFGMTSMQERAERIGASLTIVTAPRNGTEVVLAWEPSALPTQVHA